MLGRYEEALPLSQRALVIFERRWEPAIPKRRAIGLNNVATIYREQGNYGEADPLFQQALYFFIRHIAIEQRYYTTKTHALLSSQTFVGYEKDRYSCKAKERKSPPQMMVA
jgi:tetratricopeptide (TPR) repeat protein